MEHELVGRELKDARHTWHSSRETLMSTSLVASLYTHFAGIKH